MSKTPEWEVAMVHELCPCCLVKMNHQFIIPNTLSISKKIAEGIREANGKAIGFSENLCEECQDKLNRDYICLIGVDPSKSQPEKNQVQLANVYRTGNSIWIKKDVISGIFGMIPTDPFLLVEDEIFSNIGLSETETLLDVIKKNRVK